MRPSFPLPHDLRPGYLLSKYLPNIPGSTFLPQRYHRIAFRQEFSFYQEVLYISQIAIIESAHHCSSKPDCNNTADVP